MEIKYTIEILTKDIQDIEKLVGNLRNSKEASAIELDLALSKLRNVYEILTMIKADRLHELVGDKTMSEPVKAPEPVPEAVKEPEPLPEPDPEPETATAPPPEAEPASGVETTDPTILAEKFAAESSINENLAEKLGNDAEAKLVGQPIDNISRNIGINDRFLIIRELFDGDSERFTILVNDLDSAEGYQAASNMLNERFAGVMDHEGVEILASLLKRRYIR